MFKEALNQLKDDDPINKEIYTDLSFIKYSDLNRYFVSVGQNPSPENPETELYNPYLKTKYPEYKIEHPEVTPYVFCLSEHSDSKNMWVKHGSKESVAIGYTVSHQMMPEMVPSIGLDTPSFLYSTRVRYNSKEIIDNLKEYIQGTIGLFKNEYRSLIVSMLCECRLFIKNEKF